MRNLQLSETGRTVQGNARHVIAGREIVSSDGAWGHVLPGLLVAFKLAHPQVLITQGGGHERGIFEGIAENRYGLGFVTNDPRDSRFEMRVISEEDLPLAVIAPPRHPLAALPRVPAKTLEEWPFVFYPADTNSRIMELLASLGVRLNFVMELSSMEGILRAVEAGGSVTRMWDWVVDFVGGGLNVVRVPLKAPPLKRSLMIVRNRARSGSAAETALVEYVAANFKATQSLR